MRHRIFIILLSLPLAACSTPEVTEETPFRSDQFHLEVTLPPGWTGAEGPEYLARPFTDLVAFNSWGEAGFWAPEVTTATSATYSPRSVLGQIPDGGAYIVLIHFGGGPPVPAEDYGPEYTHQDLSGVWEATDCRDMGSTPGDLHNNFFKWGRLLQLEVYCDAQSSEETVANGLDGTGVRWEGVDGDSTIEVLVGLPLVSLEHPIAWPDLARRFQVYRWNTASGEFTSGEIRTISVSTCTMGRLSQ